MFAIFRAKDDKEKEATSKEWVAAVKKDIEPLLEDAGPFFAGSSELTLAEVCHHASFWLRIRRGIEKSADDLLRSISRLSCCAFMRFRAEDCFLPL